MLWLVKLRTLLSREPTVMKAFNYKALVQTHFEHCTGLGTPTKPWTMEQNFADWAFESVQHLATRSITGLS